MTAPRRVSRAKRLTPTAQMADEIASHVLHKATTEEQAAAARTVAAHALDAQDARDLLDCLGIGGAA